MKKFTQKPKDLAIYSIKSGKAWIHGLTYKECTYIAESSRAVKKRLTIWVNNTKIG